MAAEKVYLLRPAPMSRSSLEGEEEEGGRREEQM